jgi:hypothetical protein
LASHARATPSKACCAAVALASFSSHFAIPGHSPGRQPASGKPPGAGFGKIHYRILPKGQSVIFAVRLPIGHTPEFCPVRHNFEIHAFTVVQGIALVPGLGVPNSGVRQRGADFGVLNP